MSGRIASLAAPEPSEPQPYEDRVIDSARLAPLAADADSVSYNASGPARSWRVEGFASRIDSGGALRHENGLVLSGRLDTLEYGAYSLDATVRVNPRGSSVFTLWQRALPFDNGWRANNGLGTLNTPGIELSRQQYRFFLPTFPILGMETEWLHNGEVQLQASVGEPGTYNGLRLPGFSRLGGTLLTAGAQWTATPNWQGGIQLADARDVQAGFDAGEAKTNARSLFAAAVWQDKGDRFQINLLDSRANDARHDLGVWLDGEYRQDRYRHNYGVFRFDPQMFWGYSPISSDLQGGYYRVNYQSQQWIWAAGVDSVSSITNRGANGLFGTGNLRYQVDRTLGVGGGATLRHSGDDAGAAYAFADLQSQFGATRVQVDIVATRGTQQHSSQVTVDQAWPTKVGLRLSTSLSLGSENAEGARVKRASVAAFGGIDLTNNLTIEGNIRWAADRPDTKGVGRYANLGLVWRISPRWSLNATYYDNRAAAPTFPTIAPIVPIETPTLVPRDRAIFLTVRYEDHAGTPTAPLGGAPGSGAGTLVGWIFYDANDDGRRSASEKGAANLTVVLDGRFAARTDSEGKFEFPLVAAGRHVINVIPDNLALPYSIGDEGKRDVTVRTRETTTLEIAARKF